MGVRIDEGGALIAGNCALPAAVVPAVEVFFRERFAAEPVQVEVTTVEELNALPNDAVIEDSMGDVGVVHGEYVWYPESNPIRRRKVGAHYLPARVLYSPAALGGGE